MRTLAPLTVLDKLLTVISRTAVGVFFLALIVVVSLQIVTRTLGMNPPVWTEELSRYLLLYMTAFGIGLSLVTGELVNVDILQEAVSARKAWWMRLIANAAMIVLGVAMLWPAWRFTQIGAFQRSPSLLWPMHLIHASMLCLAILLILFAMLRVIGMLAGTEDGRPQRPEEI